jgi:hypothetical protein
MTEMFEGEPQASQFDLGPYREHWDRYLELRQQAKEFEVYHARFRELADRYDELVLDGKVVFTNHISGAFSEKWLKSEHPALHAAYTREKVVRVLDKEAFERDHPTLYTSGRSRALREVK